MRCALLFCLPCQGWSIYSLGARLCSTNWAISALCESAPRS